MSITAATTKNRVRAELQPHGTRARYLKGCGCEECTAANTAYGRRYRRGERIIEYSDVSARIDEIARVLHGPHLR